MEGKKDEPLKSIFMTCSVVVLFSTAAFSCSLTAEFNKVKGKDMKVDGSLCSLPRSSAFELGLAAFVFMSVAQIVATLVDGQLCSTGNECGISKNRIASAILVSSWIASIIIPVVHFATSPGLCYGLAAVMLGTAAGMNRGQPYGKGWIDGDCYIVKNGVFGTAAGVAIFTAILNLGLASTRLQLRVHRLTGPDITVTVQDRHKQGQQLHKATTAGVM